MRKSNGSGSIYKMKGKRRKPWVVRITLGYSLDGKQLRKVIGTYTTKTEAQEALVNYLKNPDFFNNRTFKDIKELWWKSYKNRIKNESTINTNIYRLKALDGLDNFKLIDIKLFHMQELFDKMETSWSFKNACKSVLNMIFEYAVKNEFIPQNNNKVKFIELGENKKIIERKIFTEEEIEIFWNNLNDNTGHKKYIYIVLILIYTGLRIGELLNLKNEDIDLQNKVLRINESKTNSGIRTIPISSKILNLFKDNINEEDTYFLKGTTTEQLSYSTFKPRFKKLLKELKIGTHTIHDTRHTFATRLNNADANQTSIIRLIGHSNFSTTENVYTHKNTEELRKAIELLK